MKLGLPQFDPEKEALKLLKIKRSGHGFHTFELQDYNQFLKRVVPLFRTIQDDYVWRGSRDPNWHLISRLTRKLQERQKNREINYDDWVSEASHLTTCQIYNYLLELRGVEELSSDHLGLLSVLKEKIVEKTKPFAVILNELVDKHKRLVFELLAMGQHHELATPLLDWSHSPQVALFFSFEEADSRIDDEGHRVVYALNRTLIERKFAPGKTIQNDGIIFVESMAHRNPRLIGQSGLFTFSPSHISLEEWVISQYGDKPNRAGNPSLPILLRFLIRNKSRKECLAELALMNIHPRSLFPDLVGAARASNYLLEQRQVDNQRI